MDSRKRPFPSQATGDGDDDDDDTQTAKRKAAEEEEDVEVDPLDAFMAEVHEEVKQLATVSKPIRVYGASRCDETEDGVAEFMEARKKRGLSNALLATMRTGTRAESDDEVYAAAKAAEQELEAEYNSNDELLIIEYGAFDKNFYETCVEIKHKSTEEVRSMRSAFEIRVGGFDVASPVESFFQCGFDLSLLAVVKKQKYEKPTAIQMQTLPVALSGRDVVGLAKTGSGKTAAYVLPLCVHVVAAPVLKKGQGPIGIILAPTRELSEQIHKQARIFAKPYNLSVTACFGGLRKYDQIRALKAGCDVAVATPGRLIDLIKGKACTTRLTTFVVLDEADRMFDMGLEKQVRSILGQIRPDRQTLLFSATMPRRVERLCRDVLTNAVRISIGQVGAVNEDIRQSVEVVPTEQHKFSWLQQRLAGFVDVGEVLIFANHKHKVEEIAEWSKQSGFRAAGIHGDMDQHSRMQILQDFRNEVHHVLVATDVASRGLDIPSIKTVINFDCAKNSDGHVHRVGRTGRAGDKDGTAHTLITPEQPRQAVFLVNSLTSAGQEVNEALHDVAMKDDRFARGGGKGKRASGRHGAGRTGGLGLGYKTTPTNDTSEFASSDFTPSHKKMESEWMTTAGRAREGETEVSAIVVQPVRSVIDSGQNDAGNPFGSTFVSSGVQGGDLKQRATVIAPKKASAVSIPPPPVPVTEQPLYLSRRKKSQSHKRPPQQSSQTSGKEFQKAFAAAQEIAARFGGSVSKGGGNATNTDADIPR